MIVKSMITSFHWVIIVVIKHICYELVIIKPSKTYDQFIIHIPYIFDKKGVYQEMGDYRLAALLCSISKIYERALHNQLIE